MKLDVPYHIFVVVDHDRRQMRIIDDQRFWDLHWPEGSEPIAVLIEPLGPKVLWRAKVEA